jgi:hypothetical protein
LLYITSGSEYLLVSVYRDEVTVAWKFDVVAHAQVHRFHKDEPDGQWTKVLIQMDNNGITGKFNFAVEDSAHSFSAPGVFPLERWQNLITSGKVMLGGRADIQDSTGEFLCHTYFVDQCFPTFVRPRPGKLFFIRRGPGPNKFTCKYISNFFLSSYIKLA